MHTPITPWNLAEDLCKRVASRNELVFYIYGGSLTTRAEGYSETREATNEERTLWEILVSGFSESKLPATLAEVEYCLLYQEGPFTVSAEDLAVIRGHEAFNPCNQRDLLLQGLRGWISNPRLDWMHYDPVTDVPLYVSRYIPVGHYYEGEFLRELYWQPSRVARELCPPLPDEVVQKVQLNLKPFVRRF